jgi:shikimate kinase
VADACAAPTPSVIAAGGGAVLDAENRTRLRAAGLVFWLQASPAKLAVRVGDASSRPLLHDDAAKALERLDALRRPAYEAAAHETVDTSGLSISAVVDAVLERFTITEEKVS